MKVQSITNQTSFNGRVIYVGYYPISTNARKGNGALFPLGLAKAERKISELIKDKSYDLYFFRNNDQEEFIQVAANRELSNILNNDFSKKSARKILVHEHLTSDAFIAGSKDAINDYERVLTGQNTKKKENLFSRLFNRFRNI